MSRVRSMMVIPQRQGEPLGWRYPQKIRERIEWQTADTYTNLINTVSNFRISNQLEMGNVEKDIQDWICKEFPNNCNDNDANIPEPPQQPKKFRDRIQSWSANRYSQSSKIELVELDEADRRARICSECPENQEWRDSCPCVTNIERTLLMIRQNREPSIKVKGCRITGQDNLTACMLGESSLKHRTKYLNELPSFCWLKDL